MSSLLGSVSSVADKTKVGVKVLQLQKLLGRTQGPARPAERGGVAVACATVAVPWARAAASAHAAHPAGKHTLPDSGALGCAQPGSTTASMDEPRTQRPSWLEG